MKKDFDIYNCHIHIFEEKDVPRGFLKLGLVAFLSTKIGYNLTLRLLRRYNFLSKNNAFYKYARFAETGKLGSQQAIFEKCEEQYPVNTKFIVLAIDMAYMNAGRVPRSFQQQIDELARLYEDKPDSVIPFIHIDPRRPGIFDIFLDAVRKGFRGVKLYPPMGHRPDDERLTPVYEYCSNFRLPLLVHCGPQSPTHYKGSKKQIRKLLDAAGIAYTSHMKKQELCAQFGHPELYIPILEKYPNMNICFAHWGSEVSWRNYIENPGARDNWFRIIRDMLGKYPNLYTDISFTLNNPEFFSILKVYMNRYPAIREKVLFGSDYYMVEVKTTEKKFGFDLRAFLGEEFFKIIAHDNPIRFLNLPPGGAPPESDRYLV